MLDLKYTEILRLNKSMGESMSGDGFQIIVLSNIVTNQFNEIFEYALRSEGINASVNSGDYDNIVQDSLKFNKSDAVIVFWELANIIDGLQYKAALMDSEAIDSLIVKVCSEIDFVLNSLNKTSIVIFNKFSSLIFNYENLRQNNFDKICKRLNDYLEQKVDSNILFIEIDKVFAKVSISKSTDFRYYYSSKALYTFEFYKNYAKTISPIITSIKGKAQKALIFDCDNTLWKGILGEDGVERIEMSSKTKSGVVFEEVQNLALELANRGILLGLCSKNNYQDVESIIVNHPDMVIRNEKITIKKVNWENKVENLKAIARELNIGVDSIVFVDDSDFEIGYVKDTLPEVKVIQVPSNLYEYPRLIRDNLFLFFNVSQSKEDLNKTEMYKQQAKREQEKGVFNDINSYLKSLQLEIAIYLNSSKLIPRISQLTQKTNQFNLTTKRYTETDIDTFMNDKAYSVFAFDIKDKFGDSGTTGVSICKIDIKNKAAFIDSFLMSCRVIGRNIELAFFDFLIKHLANLGVNIVNANYIKTYKNEQVKDFYHQLGFECIEESIEQKKYVLDIKNYTYNNIDYIKENYGTEN